MKSKFFSIMVLQAIISMASNSLAKAATLDCVESETGNPFATILENDPQMGSATLIWMNGNKTLANFSQSEDVHGLCRQTIVVDKHYGFFYESAMEVQGTGYIGQSGTRCAGLDSYPVTFNGSYAQPSRAVGAPALAISCTEHSEGH
jgi:hypothetical protein